MQTIFFVYRKSEGIHNKLLELINEFTKVERYRVNIQNSVVLLYMISGQF